MPKGFDCLQPPILTPKDIKMSIKKMVKTFYKSLYNYFIFSFIIMIPYYILLFTYCIKVLDFLLSNKEYKENIEHLLNGLQCSVVWQSSRTSSSNIDVSLTWNGNHVNSRTPESWTSKVIQCFMQNIGTLDECEIPVSISAFDFVLFHLTECFSENENIKIKSDKKNTKFIAVGFKHDVGQFKSLVEKNCKIADHVNYELVNFTYPELQLVTLL